MSIRVGFGYDVHRLVHNRKLILGGIQVPFDKGLEGHSDADVLLHAVTDALLGAAALGDIGSHFPDTDPAFKDADSAELLAHVVRLLHERGYAVHNVDATIAAQAPKLRTYIDDMRLRIADLCLVGIDAISVKATTTERLGFVGRGEGMEAYAVCSLISSTESEPSA